VGDEATLPQIQWQRSDGPSDLTQIQWEYDKTITPTTALIYNSGWDFLTQSGQKARNGMENVVLTGKWQAYTNAAHEFVASVGLAYEFGGNAATQNVGGDAYGSTSPIVYFGKGLGDLPIGMFRPLAVTGELSYSIADRKLNSTADNSGSPNAWNGAFSVQYSMPYLKAQVRDLHLPDFINRLIPVVETDWYSPASGPANGNPATVQVGVGAIYLSDTWQAGLEAVIPANKAAGSNVGVIAQFHVFLDDIFPNSIGRPILE
jgi:hypothetical protein